MTYAQNLKGLMVLAALMPACSCAHAEDERVLFCGFEKEKLLKWTKCAKAEGDFAHIILPGEYARDVYTMKKGAGTEGQWALLVSAGLDKPPDLKDTPGFSSYRKQA